ncbi:unnamed protein product [Schistosoma margrebowiei]|uniref:Uncharacterized protein n=1 Tax=Schistosoma margrebowiei TaxID=48269 RepID=A0A183MUG2_9TREM|nr:unnamed protein product [Schistosoma margrebowiei]
MGWYRTKSQHGFEKLVWLLPTYVIFGEGEISVYQQKDEYNCAAVCSVLLYCSETWPLRVEDTRKLLVFNHRCLGNIAEVRYKVLGNDGKSVDEVVNLHRLR